MSGADDFLVEIGTEELPPKALRSLMEAFGENLTVAVDEAGLSRGEVSVYASPRRLCVYISDLQRQQDDRSVEQKGPPVKVAFDDAGKPTPAPAEAEGSRLAALASPVPPTTAAPTPAAPSFINVRRSNTSRVLNIWQLPGAVDFQPFVQYLSSIRY